jgi:tellurite methyltransferase
MQRGWNWNVVKDTTKWKQPDGAVMALAPLLAAWRRPRVYDLGCGLGRHLLFFSTIGCDVAGSDISPEAVAESSRALRAVNVVPDVKVGHMTSIDQPDGSFSLVVALRVIHHAVKADIEKAIAEVHRILVPGGYFFATFKADAETRPSKATIIDAQTAIWQEEPEKGVPHFYSRREDLFLLMHDFTIVSLKYCEAYEHPAFDASRKNVWYEVLGKTT